MNQYANQDSIKAFLIKNSISGVLVSKEKVSVNLQYKAKTKGNDLDLCIKYLKRKKHITVAVFDIGYGDSLQLQMYICEWIMPYHELQIGREYAIFYHDKNILDAICIIDLEDYQRLKNNDKRMEGLLDTIRMSSEINEQESETKNKNMDIIPELSGGDKDVDDKK